MTKTKRTATAKTVTVAGRKLSKAALQAMRRDNPFVSSSELVSSDERLLDQARATMRRSLAALDQALLKAEDLLFRGKDKSGKALPYDTKLASHVAWLTEKLAVILRELRQLENHEAKTKPKPTEEQAVQALIAQGWTPPS